MLQVSHPFVGGSQILIFEGVHPPFSFLVLVAVADEVKKTMDCIPEGFVLKRCAEFSMALRRGIQIDVDLAFEGGTFIIGKGEHIRFVVVPQVRPIQIVNGGMIGENQRDVLETNTLPPNHLRQNPPAKIRVKCERRMLILNLYRPLKFHSTQNTEHRTENRERR